MKTFFQKYKHALWLLYFPIYMIFFAYLEANVTTKYHILHSSFDSYIPFCEYFIIPYVTWFFFVAVAIIYFLFKAQKTEYYQFLAALYVGMTVFLIVSALYPNGLNLRPDTFVRDNIFTHMVSYLYSIDTATNVLPSIHVYNTLCVWFAVAHCKSLKKHRFILIGTSILSILIIASTLFLKQHSCIDVMCSLVLGFFVYAAIYSSHAIFFRTPSVEKQKETSSVF